MPVYFVSYCVGRFTKWGHRQACTDY